MKPIRVRLPSVIMPDHAFERWLMRTNRKPYKQRALAAMIAHKLYERFGTGQPTIGLVIPLDLGGKIRAVLELTEAGWVCRTFLGPDEPFIKEAG
jgi:hypothetical protein